MAYLEWRCVTKVFDRRRVLDGVDLSMEKGEILALLGPSGSGKTTLLRITCGLDRPDAGAVVLDGEDITEVPTHLRAMGLMFQDYNLFPHLDVEGNVAFGLRMKHWPREKRSARVREMLDLVRLGSSAKRSVSTLSGGERQRVALARSLAPSPSLLMLDEPFGALDAVLRAEILDELPAIMRKAEATVLYVTHDRAEALSVADRIGLINGGVIVQAGTPRKLMDSPACAFTAAFLGLGALVPARAYGGRVETDVGSFRAGGLPDREGILLIRPAAISIPPSAGAAVLEAVVLAMIPGPDMTTFRLGLQGRQRLYEVSIRMVRDEGLPQPGSRVAAGLDVSKTMMLEE